MHLRVWRTEFDVERRADLERFAREVSSPMFEQLDGCVGHLFAVDGSTWLTQTYWEAPDAIVRAEATDAYREVVRRIVEAGFLGDEQTVEVFEIIGNAVPQ